MFLQQKSYYTIYTIYITVFRGKVYKVYHCVLGIGYLYYSLSAWKRLWKVRGDVFGRVLSTGTIESQIERCTLVAVLFSRETWWNRLGWNVKCAAKVSLLLQWWISNSSELQFENDSIFKTITAITRVSTNLTKISKEQKKKSCTPN